ncbi:hypothetical protein P3S68_000484 [Capsicum galapagoense]
MANNLTKCEFVALQSSGKNYISWVLDIEIHLDIMGLGDTIKKENITSSQNRAKAMIFLHHHLDGVNDVHAHHARRGKSRDRGRDDQERNSVPGVNHSSNKKRKDDKREAIIYFQCGRKEHYSRDCRALKHLVDLYQASLKKKERNSKANFLSENDVDITSLDITDFFEHPEGKIDHLIGDFSVNMEE